MFGFDKLRRIGSSGRLGSTRYRRFQFLSGATALLFSLAGGMRATLLLAVVVAGLWATPVFAFEERVALVIGNDAYPSEPLRNAVNDAQQVAKTLKDLGFKVIFKTNVDFTTMRAAAVEFANLLDNNYSAVFYYAGHGIQHRGKNYLVPIDAKLTSETEVVFNALEVTQVLERMQDANVRHKFLILDACRNNPFRAVFGSNASQGLAKMHTPPGTTIAFAAQAGAVAEDGKGENGVYTKNLLSELKKPDIQAALMFQQVSQAVQVETNGRQTPEVQSVAASKGFFFFNDSRLTGPDSGTGSTANAANSDNTRASADTEAKVDLEFWSNVKDSSRAEDFRAYLDQFPNGRFAILARNRIFNNQRQQAPKEIAAPSNTAQKTASTAIKPAPERASETPAAKDQTVAIAPMPEPSVQLADSRGIETKPGEGATAQQVVRAPAIGTDNAGTSASHAIAGNAAPVEAAPAVPRDQIAAISPKPKVAEPQLNVALDRLVSGVIEFSGGARYTGQYKETKEKTKIPHGNGEYSARDFRYVGEFKDGKKHGRGLYTWANGDSFNGDFADDLPNGKGQYLFASGDEYSGDIVAGRISGQGVYRTKGMDRIEGSFVDAKANGRALYLFASGDRYEGEMAAGRLSGKGVYTTKGLDRIEATFRDGKADGEGICYFANNDRYEGQMKSGALTGKGKYFYSNGLRSEGEFVDGRLHGKGTFYFNDGSWFEGEFEDGLKKAKGFSYLKDGTRRAAVIVDNAVKIVDGG